MLMEVPKFVGKNVTLAPHMYMWSEQQAIATKFAMDDCTYIMNGPRFTSKLTHYHVSNGWPPCACISRMQWYHGQVQVLHMCTE